MLEVQNITKKYGSQTALKNVSFSIGKGEIAGFLGPNGAGKSTALKLITGSLPMDSGSVVISGYDLRREPLKAKFHTGYLPENNPLYDDMYVTEYLDYVAGLYLLDNRKERVAEIIRQTGLQAEAHKKIEQLSKGYRQRAGLAQALIHNPDVLVLDEPSSGLDPNQSSEINRLLLRLQPEKTILFSSHTLPEVAAVCTRILFIHRGEIVADLPRNEIEDLEVLFKELTAV
ncbi:MAG: ATP-binding cassette domain-containing protein [Dysgonamonadaceae bacterium]|jgi:ABC-2 type transport system ATP-binding protein|nr:ATP-binding cassette domain-containing protein [Dysgonamonadaceae bacterium]